MRASEPVLRSTAAAATIALSLSLAACSGTARTAATASPASPSPTATESPSPSVDPRHQACLDSVNGMIAVERKVNAAVNTLNSGSNTNAAHQTFDAAIDTQITALRQVQASGEVAALRASLVKALTQVSQGDQKALLATNTATYDAGVAESKAGEARLKQIYTQVGIEGARCP
ncbi:MAG TPA: hypothetical protein VEN82_08795 [Actinomycetota bacterium]|nr:hypothetical protein [Actinomycetota bacterium]